jgi:tetratricopeptide (TPR) repeat protein
MSERKLRTAPPPRGRTALGALGILWAIPLLGGWSFFDPFFENVEKGNAAAEGGDDAAALEHYERAAEAVPSSPVPDFNRGIVLARGEDPAPARDAFLGAAAAEDSEIAADALYNLGNVHFDHEEYGRAIEAYLKSLDLDSEDGDARRNLELAVRRLQEQQQQPQPQPQPEESENEEDEDRPEPTPPDEPSEGQDESPTPEEEPEDEEPPDSTRQPRPEERMSREDAERLLNAVETEELKVLEQLQPSEEESRGVARDDW